MSHFYIQVLSEAWLEKQVKGEGTFLIRKICTNVLIVDKNRHRCSKGERNPSGNTHCQSSKEHEIENYNELTSKLP